jgi:hypothetical protein
MPTKSQLWFVTKKAAVVIGVLALTHAVAAPRNCGGCGVKAAKSQMAVNPAENGALGGPDTKIKKTILNNNSTTGMGPPDGGMSAKGFNPQPDPPGINFRVETPRINTPVNIGSSAGIGSSVRGR